MTVDLKVAGVQGAVIVQDLPIHIMVIQVPILVIVAPHHILESVLCIHQSAHTIVLHIMVTNQTKPVFQMTVSVFQMLNKEFITLNYLLDFL